MSFYLPAAEEICSCRRQIEDFLSSVMHWASQRSALDIRKRTSPVSNHNLIYKMTTTGFYVILWISRPEYRSDNIVQSIAVVLSVLLY